MNLQKRAFALALTLLILWCTPAFALDLLTDHSMTKAAVPATGVALNKVSVLLRKGKTVTLKAKFTPTNASDKKVTWQSSDASVAKVSGKGIVKALKAGTATISAVTRDGGFVAACRVAVWSKRMRDMSFESVHGYYMVTGQQLQPVMEFDPETYWLPNYAMKWVSSNPGVASVSPDGVVTAIKPGLAVISADTGIKATTGRAGKDWAEFVVTDRELQPGDPLLANDMVMVIGGVSVRSNMRYRDIKALFPGGKKTNPAGYMGSVYKVGKLTFMFNGRGSNPPFYCVQSTAPGQKLGREIGVGSTATELLAKFGKPDFVTYERLGKDKGMPLALTYLQTGGHDHLTFSVNTQTQLVYKVELTGDA